MSFLEEVLAQDLTKAGIPFEREYRFHPERKWRADFSITGTTLLVEVEGGAGFGRHSRKQGFESDAKKYAAAARMGFVVLRFTSEQVKGRMAEGMDSEAVETIRCAYKYWRESA